MDLQKINELLNGKNISVKESVTNSGASEAYLLTVFSLPNEERIETLIPYVYRRSNMQLSSEEDIAVYLDSIKSCFQKENIEKWKSTVLHELENKPNKENLPQKILKVLLNKICLGVPQSELPKNPNIQKIIQKLKDDGYIISVRPIRRSNSGEETSYWLLPLKRLGKTVYETMSPQFVKKVKKVLSNWDAYEAKEGNPLHLLPDHKFSEIRWTPDTAEKNENDMPEEDVKTKFQLLSNQRNQQKREVCRKCKQTGLRGSIYGIKYYYSGNEKWDSSIPEVGKDAEAGCVGCPWYDIQKWRDSLQQLIDGKK